MCEICNGIGSCPCCTIYPETEPCPECEGSGIEAYINLETGQEITYEEFSFLPDADRESVKCQVCDGEGFILKD